VDWLISGSFEKQTISAKSRKFRAAYHARAAEERPEKQALKKQGPGGGSAGAQKA
jgi:hypothetical protein